MKKILIGLPIILLAFVCSIVYVPYTKLVPLKGHDNIRIMSYNLKNGWSDYEAWQERKGLLADQIKAHQPDSIGVQEADEPWMYHEGGLTNLLPDYAFVGLGRDDGGKSGEHAAIFYLKDKYEVIDSGNFWLSETPEIPSVGWDAAIKRICTWVTLRDKTSLEVYSHVNVHLDHIGKIARLESVQLIMDKIQTIQGPLVLTGDFNFLQDSSNYDIIIDEGLYDSKKVAEDSVSYATMNYFKRLNLWFLKPIDFCFVDESWQVINYRVDNHYMVAGRPVSDHYPVIVDLKRK